MTGHMSRDKILRRSLFTLVVLVAFSYGAAVGRYLLFPFYPLPASVKYISDIRSNIIDKPKNIVDDYSMDFNSVHLASPFIQYNIDNIDYPHSSV